MRSQKFISKFSKFALLVIGAFALMSAFGLVVLPGLALAMAGTVVEGGTVTQQSAVENDVLDIADIQRKVEAYKQYQTPLLTLISNNKAPAVDSWKYEYYAIDNRGLFSTVSAASAISSSNLVTLTVASNEMFTRFNQVSFTGITTATTKISGGKFLVGIVTGIGDNDTITVKLLNPGTTLAAGDFTDEKVYRSGSAMNEKAASTTAWGKLPEKDYNYIQNFMEQIEESEFQKLMKKEADWGIKDLKKMAIEDFKMQRERSFLTGFRAKTSVSIDGQNNDIYTCGGILNDEDIPRLSNQDLSAMTEETFVTWLKTIFTGNNGAKTRHLLGGCDMVEAIEHVNVGNKWITAKETEVVNGINFVKFVSTFGTLNITYYEQLDLLGMHKNALVIDKDNLWVGDLEGAGFNVRPLDYKSSGIAKVDAAVIEQSSTILIKNKATHHMILGV